MNTKDNEVSKEKGGLPDKGDGKSPDTNQEEVTKVTSVLEFLKWVEGLDGTEILFRGHSCCEWKVESGASRLFRSKTSENSTSYTNSEISHNRNIIENTKIQGIYDNLNSTTVKTDWGILAQQQHIGAATSLLDFSSNPLVSLFFACQKCPKRYKCECNQKGGEVYSIAVDHPDDFDEFDSLDKLEKYKVEDVINGYRSIYWKPGHINNRIIAQHSYFIVGGQFDDLKKCFIPEEKKEDILVYLHRFYDIKRITLFPDEAGIAEAYSTNPKYNVVYLEYLESGLEFHRRGQYEQAIEKYTKIIDNDKYKNYYKRQAYNYRGFARVFWGVQFEVSGEIQENIKQYEAGIKDFNKGIILDEDIMIKKSDETQEIIKQYIAGIKDFNNGIILDKAIMIKNFDEIQKTIKQYVAGIKDFNNGIILDKAIMIKKFGETQKTIKQYVASIKDFNNGIILDKAILIKESIDTMHKTTKDLLKCNFNLALANMRLANFYKNCGNNKKYENSLKKAITYIEKVLYCDNNYAEAYSLHGVVQAELGEYEKALNYINTALEINSNSHRIYLDRANIRRIQIIRGKLINNTEQLQKYCNEIIRDCDMVNGIRSNCYEAYIYRGIFNSILGNSKATIQKDFDTALKIKQGVVDTNHLYGVALFTLAGNLENGIEIMDKDAYEEIIKICEESLIHLEIFIKVYPKNKNVIKFISNVKNKIIELKNN